MSRLPFIVSESVLQQKSGLPLTIRTFDDDLELDEVNGSTNTVLIYVPENDKMNSTFFLVQPNEDIGEMFMRHIQVYSLSIFKDRENGLENYLKKLSKEVENCSMQCSKCANQMSFDGSRYICRCGNSYQHIMTWGTSTVNTVGMIATFVPYGTSIPLSNRCEYCGNKFVEDLRGCCFSCGAPSAK